MDDQCLPHIKKREHILDIDKDFSNQTLFDNGKIIDVQKRISGYVESKEFNDWLSLIYQEEVFVLRAREDRTVSLWSGVPDQLQTDRKRAFITAAAINIINEQSMNKLRQDIKDKYERM